MHDEGGLESAGENSHHHRHLHLPHLFDFGSDHKRQINTEAQSESTREHSNSEENARSYSHGFVDAAVGIIAHAGTHLFGGHHHSPATSSHGTSSDINGGLNGRTGSQPVSRLQSRSSSPLPSRSRSGSLDIGLNITGKMLKLIGALLSLDIVEVWRFNDPEYTCVFIYTTEELKSNPGVITSNSYVLKEDEKHVLSPKVVRITNSNV